jgi:hypothetical protein
MMRTVIIFTALALGTTRADNLRARFLQPAANCSAYATTSNNCAASSCSSCFNAGGRPGVLCNAGGTGYYCGADATPG